MPLILALKFDQQIMIFQSRFLDLFFLIFCRTVSKIVDFGTPFEIRWDPKSAPGPRKDPAERVWIVFASHCFSILHCTLPHITFSFVVSLGKCICRSPCDSRRAKRGVLGAADFQMDPKIVRATAPFFNVFFNFPKIMKIIENHCFCNGF